jgi:hypothetical protein
MSSAAWHGFRKAGSRPTTPDAPTHPGPAGRVASVRRAQRGAWASSRRRAASNSEMTNCSNSESRLAAAFRASRAHCCSGSARVLARAATADQHPATQPLLGGVPRVHPVGRSRGDLAGVVGGQVGVPAGCTYPDQGLVPVPTGRA